MVININESMYFLYCSPRSSITLSHRKKYLRGRRDNNKYRDHHNSETNYVLTSSTDYLLLQNKLPHLIFMFQFKKVIRIKHEVEWMYDSLSVPFIPAPRYTSKLPIIRLNSNGLFYTKPASSPRLV